MRTTITLDDDAMELSTTVLNGLPVFDAPGDFPLITDEMVPHLAEED